jgi:hypothetical protein
MHQNLAATHQMLANAMLAFSMHETSTSRGKRLADGEPNNPDGAGHQRCPILKQAFLHENHYSITSSARASRVVGALRPMPLLGGHLILEEST